MNPEDQLVKLLSEHNFDLIRHRKHKIYRNSDGLTFVVASTPSDRRSSQNAFSTLKRILRRINPEIEPIEITKSTSIKPIPTDLPTSSLESVSTNEYSSESLSDQDWENWKRQFWHDEKLREKNERFLFAVGRYVGRVSELLNKREDIAIGAATDAVKQLLRGLQYKSKVVLYNAKFFDQGIVIKEVPELPILWASNGRIGVSSFLFMDAYVQHGTSKVPTLRFDWDGLPVVFELPEKELRKFYMPNL